MESLNSNSQERELHQLQQMQDNAKESCMTSFQLLHSFLQVLSYDESKSRRVSECAFMTLFGQDNETFTRTIEMTEKLFAEYTGIKVKQFRETLLLHMGNVKKSVAERTRHKRQYDRRMNERQMQSRESKVVSSKALDASLVVTECSGTKSDEHITSSSSGTYITHVVDADIRPVNDQVPSAEVHLTAPHNVLANEQQHTDQSEPSYDTYLLEKVDSNTTPDSTNMSHRGGEIDQDAEQDQVKSPLLKAEFLKTNDMVEKEVYNELSNRFLQLEKQCISLEISIQQKEESFQCNKLCKNQDSPEFCEFYEINELKAQLQAKNSTINNLKKQIKNAHEKSNEAKNMFLAKPHHVIAPVLSRNSQEESYGSNDMAHNHYLAEARKKTLERNRNSKPSVMPYVRLQNTVNGHRFSPKKTSDVYEKTSPRSCLRWKPTGKIFTTVGLKWIPTGKLFDSFTSKADTGPPNGSNDDITNPYECDQTLNVSAVLFNLKL
ncbi:hypothetical protein Tco_1394661 [Tanacetum coccineum]